MGTYKVPQNVEAEDKLLGPFTFRQFIFLMITAALIFVAWLFSKINGWLTILPLPGILLFGFLGVYHREDQPVEIYLLAALNYVFKPHKRVWDPEGDLENVRLIAPPPKEVPKAKHLAEAERGQLQQLAHIMDTRGWSVKRPELNESVQDHNIDYADRLTAPDPQAMGQEPIDVHSSDDLLDPVNFPDAEKYRQLAEVSTRQVKERAVMAMRQAAKRGSDLPLTTAGVALGPTEPPALVATPPPVTTSTPPPPSAVQRPSYLRADIVKNDQLSVQQLANMVNRPAQPTELGKGQEVDLPSPHHA